MTPREFDRVVGKFRMEITEGGSHRKAKFYYQGELIISTLRSRSPQEFESHQVRRQLKLDNRQLRAAIRCTLGLEDYIAILRERGMI